MNTIDLIEYCYHCETVTINDCHNNKCKYANICTKDLFHSLTTHYAEGEI